VLRQYEGDYALWRFGTDYEETAIRLTGNLSYNDGEVTTQWGVDGYGLIMRSTWHVGTLLRDGTLIQVLPEIPTPNADIHALYLANAHVPRRVRELITHLANGLRDRIEPLPGA
jgi:LysR family transcriptional regulator, transcriptional activator for dmlA